MPGSVLERLEIMFGCHQYADNKAIEATDVDVVIWRELIMQSIHDMGVHEPASL